MSIRGLRIITNLDCNARCTFCYQKNKQKLLLPLEALDQCQNKRYEYITLMGGESLLHYDHLVNILCRVNNCADEIALTTNGSLLTHHKVVELKHLGLTRINFSIPTVNENRYYKMVGHHFLSLLTNLFETERILPVRINIPVVGQTREDLFGTIRFMWEMGYNFTLCSEQRKPLVDKLIFEKYGFKFVKDNGFGLCQLIHEGKEVYYYSHKDNYKNSDLILSPVIETLGWDKYCEEVRV
jgi:molybdenum cofactor biosynthesis enzyme MoaA